MAAKDNKPQGGEYKKRAMGMGKDYKKSLAGGPATSKPKAGKE